MRATGIVRRIDELGRVTIPKELRKTLRIKEGDPLEIFTERDELILKKYSPMNNLEEVIFTLSKTLNEMTDHAVLICDSDAFICSVGAKECQFMRPSLDIEKIISERKMTVINYAEGMQAIKITDDEDFGFLNEVILPILSPSGDDIGAIIIADKRKDAPISSTDIKLAMLAAAFISSYSL